MVVEESNLWWREVDRSHGRPGVVDNDIQLWSLQISGLLRQKGKKARDRGSASWSWLGVVVREAHHGC